MTHIKLVYSQDINKKFLRLCLSKKSPDANNRKGDSSASSPEETFRSRQEHLKYDLHKVLNVFLKLVTDRPNFRKIVGLQKIHLNFYYYLKYLFTTSALLTFVLRVV